MRVNIRSKEGTLLFEKEQVFGRLNEYIGELFDNATPEQLEIENQDLLSPIIKSEIDFALKDHLRTIGKNDNDHISYQFYTVFPIALLVTGRCHCTKCAFCAITWWSLTSF